MLLMKLQDNLNLYIITYVIILFFYKNLNLTYQPQWATTLLEITFSLTTFIYTSLTYLSFVYCILCKSPCL